MLITLHSEESGRDSKETIVGYIFMLMDKLPAQTGAKSTGIFTAYDLQPRCSPRRYSQASKAHPRSAKAWSCTLFYWATESL